jgi:Gluconate 2-dehydrogenase subunit 3
MNSQVIGRRKALKYFSLLAASAAGQEFLASWLPAAQNAHVGYMHPGAVAAAQAQSASPYSPKFFKPEEYRTVEMLTELIIPTDDQPGAKEAQVARYIDFLVYSAAEYLPQMQKEWSDGLATLEKLSQQNYNHAFQDLSPKQQEALLTEMSVPEHNHQASHPGFAFYRLVKETTVEAFYSSKIGLVDVLGYQGPAYLSEFVGCTHPEHQT